VNEGDLKIVEAMRGFIDARAWTLEQFARKVGVSGSTVSELLRGTYKGSGTTVIGKIQRFLEFETNRRWMPSDVRPVETVGYRAIEAVCRYAHEKGKGALVLADAGAGKTMALTAYSKDSPNAFYIECDQSHSGWRQLAATVADAVFAGGGRTTGARVWKEILKTLKNTGALLLFDDAHYLHVASLNAVMKLHDQTGCGFVLAGIPMLHRQMASSKDAPWFAQILSRCAMMRAFDPHRTCRQDVLAVAKAAAGDKRLDPGAENRVAGEVAKRGALRRVAQIVELATTFTRTDRISAKEIEKAVRYRGGI